MISNQNIFVKNKEDMNKEESKEFHVIFNSKVYEGVVYEEYDYTPATYDEDVEIIPISFEIVCFLVDFEKGTREPIEPSKELEAKILEEAT